MALVERVQSGARRSPTGEAFSPDFQIAFPYRGVFVWHVGGEAIVSDPNQVLFVKGGEPFHLGADPSNGFGEIVITPAVATLRDLVETGGYDLERHPLFRARSRRATPQLQRHCLAFAHRAADRHEHDDLGAEEELLALMRHALTLEPPPVVTSRQTRRLLRRTKEFLHTQFRRRLQLSEIAGAVGASPAYLTDVFRRFEGTSLQRYVMQLRLARALAELPNADDITTLALHLGFSSHSHFTLVFRRAFGCTPSEFRRQIRRPETPRVIDRISA